MSSWIFESTSVFLQGIEDLAAACRDWEQCAVLLGATELWHRLYYHSLNRDEIEFRKKDFEQTQQALKTETFNCLFEQGKVLSLKEALEYGLAYLEADTAE